MISRSLPFGVHKKDNDFKTLILLYVDCLGFLDPVLVSVLAKHCASKLLFYEHLLNVHSNRANFMS